MFTFNLYARWCIPDPAFVADGATEELAVALCALKIGAQT